VYQKSLGKLHESLTTQCFELALMVTGPYAGLILLQTQLEKLETEKHFRRSLDYESRVAGGVKVTTSCCYASRDQGSQVWRYIREALSELAWAAGRARPCDCLNPDQPVYSNVQDDCDGYYFRTLRTETGCSYKLQRHKICLQIRLTSCYVSIRDISIGIYTTVCARGFAQPAVTGSDCFPRCKGFRETLPV